MRIIGPQDIVITEIDPNDPSNISENNETINIVEKKMQLTHAPRAALAKP